MLRRSKLRNRMMGNILGRRMAQFPGSGGGGVVDPYAAIRASLTAQWRMNDASGNATDSVGGYTLTQSGTSGSTTGVLNGCRTFDGLCYFSRTAEAALMPLGVDFSFCIWFYVAASAANHQIFSLRNAGSADGNLLFILRTETNDLVMYTGDGVGGLDSTMIDPAMSMGVWHNLVGSFKNSTKALRWMYDGAAVASDTMTAAPTTSPATPKIALGGEVLELIFNGSRIDECDYAVGTLWTDDQFALLWNGGLGVQL